LNLPAQRRLRDAESLGWLTSTTYPRQRQLHRPIDLFV
jgi:hypothetical protein